MTKARGTVGSTRYRVDLREVRNEDDQQARMALCPVDPRVRIAEDGQVSMWIPGLPVSARRPVNLVGEL